MRVELDRENALTKSMVAHPMAWFEHSPAFEVTDSARVAVVARYPADQDPLASGWLLGGELLRGKAAMVDVTLGKGHVVLFGFRPQYRGQSMGMYPLIWEVLKR